MDPEKVKLFETHGETPVVDTEKDKQEILRDLELQLANKQQELAVLEPELRSVPTGELMSKKNQLEREIEAIKLQKSTLVQEAAPSQAEIKTAPEQSIRPEAPVDDFKTTIESDPDFLKKEFVKQQTKPTTETFLEKTNKGLDDIGKEYAVKIADTKDQSQIDQSIEQSVGQFETPDQLKQEAEKNAEQIEKMTTEAAPGKLESPKETKTEKKTVLTEIFSNPESEKRMQEIRTEINQEKDVIQALEEELAERKNNVKVLEGEMNKLEQENLVTFFRNVPGIETANKRGATNALRGKVISELYAALKKYDKIGEQNFMGKVMKHLSIRMRELFYELYPEVVSRKEKVAKEKTRVRAKKTKGAIRGMGLVGTEGASMA